MYRMVRQRWIRQYSGAAVGILPCCVGFLTGRRRAVDGTVSVGQFDWGSRLPKKKGNGGAQRYPQLGWKPSAGAKAKGVLTARPTKSSRDEVRLSDPAVLNGKAVAQRIKSYLGITGLISPKVPHRQGGLAPRCRLIASWS